VAMLTSLVPTTFDASIDDSDTIVAMDNII
jgi:hypothetical protein